jgi:hypothetical protein
MEKSEFSPKPGDETSDFYHSNYCYFAGGVYFST